MMSQMRSASINRNLGIIADDITQNRARSHVSAISFLPNKDTEHAVSPTAKHRALGSSTAAKPSCNKTVSLAKHKKTI